MTRSSFFSPILLSLFLASVILLSPPVAASQQPVADFSISPGNSSLDVTLADTSDGPHSGWFWSFGDGAFSYGRAPAHTYAGPGSYAISLIISDTAGHASIKKRFVAFRPVRPAYPWLAFQDFFFKPAPPTTFRETEDHLIMQENTENLSTLHDSLVRPLTQEHVPPGHTVTFRQSGLPPGLNWSVILVEGNGSRFAKNSSAAAISFPGITGPCSYSVPLVVFGKKHVNISAIPPFGVIDAGTNTVDVRFTHIEPSWAGYVAAEDVAERQPNVTSVRGSWRIPDLSGNPPEMATVFQWIGIGGFFPGDSHNLIQTGTASCIGGLCPVQYNYGWTELLPDNSEPIPWDFRVLPGDVMQAEIHEDSPGRWNVSLADLTQDWHYRKTVFYNSSRDSAEWILEKPTYAGEIHDLAGFVGAGFGTGTLSTGGNDATIGPVTGPAGSFPGFSVTMVRDNTSRAIPSNLSPEGGFTVHGFSGNGG